MGQLTVKEARVFQYISREIEEEGIPPTYRRIAQTLRMDRKSVYQYLKALERKGRIARQRGKIQLPPKWRSERGLPLVEGKIAAGEPILANGNIRDRVDLRDIYGRGEGLFLVQVQGDSMVGAGISDGDFVVVRQQPMVENGEIGVAYLGPEQEATVKRIYRRKQGILLKPENPAYPRVVVPAGDPHFRVGGKVVGVVRRL